MLRISLGERVPDESTVRKLTRRIGPQTVNELTRTLLETATRQKRFVARAVRIDSPVVAADVKYPTDANLASHGVKALAREARKLAGLVKERKRRVRPSLSTSGETLTIEESMSLEGENGERRNVGDEHEWS